MKTYLFLFFSGLMLALSNTALAQRNAAFENYIQQYSKIAQSERLRTGVPASIKMAQALLESGAGKSELATKANNHFGIKCGGDWDGPTFYREDDDRDSTGVIVPSCFRKYRKPEDSYVAHSEFLKGRRRYDFLFDLKSGDYKGWAYGLSKAGYATNPKYPELLIGIIENYDLHKLDEDEGPLADGGVKHRPGRRPKLPVGDVSMANSRKYISANKGVTLIDIARKYEVAPSKLKAFNERLDAPMDAPLADNTRVYIEKKRNWFRGKQKYHYVKAGETMYSISQLYGLRLDKLYNRNRLSENSEPTVGARLNLRGCTPKSEVPPSRARNVNDDKYVPQSTAKPNTGTSSGGGSGTRPSTPNTPSTPNNGGSGTRPNNGGPASGPGKVNPDGTLDMEITPGSVSTPSTNPPAPTPPHTTRPPVGADVVTPAPTPKPTPTPPAGAVYHTVTQGQTLFAISKIYGTTVQKLQVLNNMTTTNLSVGQQIRVK